MAKKSCSCKKEEECEECPEWIFTFADLVMLMMGFFVILWVLKPAPGKDGEPKQELPLEVLAEIRAALNYTPQPNSDDPVDKYMLLKNLSRLKFNGPGERGKSSHEIQGAEGTDPDVTAIRMGNQCVVGGRILFDSKSVSLDKQDQRELDQIANQIRGHRNLVLIKGHCGMDEFGEKGSAQQRMDLSIRRAQVVSDYLTGKGVDPDVLRVLGCSIFEPVRQGDYGPEGQAANRRVEVEATETLVEQFQDHKKAPATAPTPNHP